MTTPFGEISLARYPRRDDEPLRAYDGADAYLLDEIATLYADAASFLIIGDRHGALTTALAADHDVTMWSDSMLARLAAQANLEDNNRFASVTDQAPEGGFDLVIVRPNKARALVASQFAAIAPRLRDGTPVLLGDMVKHLGRWMTEALETYIGPTSASLAKRKARLLRSERDGRIGPDVEWTSYEWDGITLHNAPGTFASSGVDGGARLLLDQLPRDLGNARVADLGCGNGILAIASAAANPDASYLLIDESSNAIASAQRSWTANLGERAATFQTADGLLDAEPESLDVVLCNPPFHEGTTTDEWFGRRMLQQTHRALRPGGTAYVVANRHLHHHQYLRAEFAHVEVVDSNAKFSVLKAQR